jgi:hypothetical protein
MKKLFMVLAATVICGACLFTSCKKDEDLKLDEKIIGKWITAESDGKAILTNEKVVLDFVSATEVYESLSFQGADRPGTPWNDRQKDIVDINGNDVTLTHSPEPGTTVIVDLHVERLTNSAMVAKRTVTVRKDGGLVRSDKDIVRCEKLNVDYRADILGTWQGHCTSEGSVFDDGEEHRWEYRADGNFVYYVKDGDNWVPSTNALNQYFVAGNLLCTRWVDNGEEHREWWEITIDGSQMHWTALRQNPDGTTFTATFEMSKVN